MANDLRTAFEQDLTNFILDLGYFLDKRSITTGDYMTIRGKIRDIKVYLDNKLLGCPNGKHSGDCSKVKH